MDELRDFFSGPSGSRPQRLRTPLTSGRRITKEDTSNLLNRPEEHRHSVVPSGTDYARDIKEKETQMYLKNETDRNFESVSRGLDSLEYLSSFDASIQNIEELNEEAMTAVYSKYSFQRKEDTNNLAINEFKQQILNRIRGFPVIIIEGPTGCGKTTQVPQWILDDCYQNRKPCKIIVTQPRRIAAISIAKRVAQERGWDVGGLVGYQVGLENRTTSDTRIHYVTTGILLQKLVAAKNMNEYTHVILDEVHERGQEMDFLILIVKRLLYTVSPGVKVILMSATFNRKAFADYFLLPTPKGLQMSPCFKIVKNEPLFTVKIFYLDHLGRFSLCDPPTTNNDDPGIALEMHHLVVRLVNAFEHIDKKEDDYTNRDEADLPSVLIFLPGINEIEVLYGCLTDLKLRAKICDAESVNYKWWVLPLHSTITADEQVRVFQRAPPGHRKIILATNIAESSITVPDIKYVIDYCLMKILTADKNTNFTSLQLEWASKSNCEQRAGRAGRVRDGRVYRLVSDTFYENLKQDCEPEIVRCPLERLVLLAKMLDMGAPSDILALAMDPPDMSNIHKTVLVLKEVGALKKSFEDEDWCGSDGDITYLGRVMAKLPVDVRVAKLIVLGHIFGVLEDSIIMAAAMSVKNIFSSPFRERLNAYNSKLTWADGSTSDCIAFLNVYKVWNHLRQQQFFKQPGNNEVQWARRFYVQVRALRELDDMVRELKMRLSREGIEPLKGKSPWAKSELALVLKVIMAGAFYPQYFVQVSHDESREREALRTLYGHNPRNTVYLKNFPDNQPGDVYSSSLKKIIKQLIGDEPRVTFDKNSRKVYLTFSDGSHFKKDTDSKADPTIPGQVLLPVYKAVKARQLRMDIRIMLLSPDRAQELATALEMEKMNLDKDFLVPRLPDLDDTHIPIRISEFITVSKFWVQYDDESTINDLMTIKAILNQGKLLAHTDPVTPGMVVAAPYKDNNTKTTMRRARVIKVLPRDMNEVVYIDYGGVSCVSSSHLCVIAAGSIAASLPALAMQCVLSGVAPGVMGAASYPRAAVTLFHSTVSKQPLMAKVYSVTHGVVSIELLADNGRINLNELLINHGYAIRCEESYESKLNHDLRQSSTELNMVQKRAYNKEQLEMAFHEIRRQEPISAKECVADVVLKGPYSPLESTLHNLMYASRDKLVHVEWNSVNSVLLDTEPQETYERLLVAAEVGQNESQSRLTLRHTTLMPNIPGLPAILALLFCPTAELRRDSGSSHYVSALCGLGSDDEGMPYFPEHDLLISIKALLTLEDIGHINHIRHLMDYIIYCGNGQDEPDEDDEFRPKVPTYIREDILKLLKVRRKHCESETVPNAWEWRSVPDHELLEINVPGMVERAVIYPLHAPQELKPMSCEQLLALKEDNDRLKLLVARTPISSNAEMQCKLCGTTPMPAHAMRIHLYSNSHREKEEDFIIFNS